MFIILYNFTYVNSFRRNSLTFLISLLTAMISYDIIYFRTIYYREDAMTIGEKIKNARNLRGLTQKELGIKLGFDEKSADVRVAQYESGTRTPKSELLSEIAAVLDVNKNSLRDPSLENTETFIHLLFDLEQEAKKHHTNNFSIISVPDELGNIQSALQFHNHLLNEFLSEWQLRRKELSEGIITEEEYAEWMMNFPATSDGCGKNEPIKKWRK